MATKRGGAKDPGRSRVPSQQIAMSEPNVTSSKAGEKNQMMTGQPKLVPRDHITFNLEKLILQQLQPTVAPTAKNIMFKNRVVVSMGKRHRAKFTQTGLLCPLISWFITSDASDWAPNKSWHICPKTVAAQEHSGSAELGGVFPTVIFLACLYGKLESVWSFANSTYYNNKANIQLHITNEIPLHAENSVFTQLD